MKLKQIFNLKNIKSFIQGNYNYYYDQLVGLHPYIQEQILYRVEQCKYDCMLQNKCRNCGCDVPKKMFVVESCYDENESGNINRFPDLMNEEDWEQYKKDNKIKIK
jgi:hypothetical protein